MADYRNLAGDQTWFEGAPPLAEVVLEDYGEKVKRIIYAEAFKPGACWWHADGRPARRGLAPDRMSDYVCLATRTPCSDAVERLAVEQLTWDGQHMGLYGDKPDVAVIELPPITAKGGEVLKSQLEEAMRTSLDRPTLMPATDPFVSVFEPQHRDAWIRINTAGRVKFSEALMDRYRGMKVDIAINPGTGKIRVGEAEHGKVLSNRGYVFARRLTPMIDFKGQPSAVVYLFDQPDGYLYGELTLAESATDSI